jgi:RNA polymerase primary sigma factor
MKNGKKELDQDQVDELVQRMLEDAVTDPRGNLDELAAYMAPLKMFPVLREPAQYEPLFAAYHGDDPVRRTRARDLLVYGNIRLVLRVALRYQGRGLALSDMLQEGTTGLMKAIDMFDLTKGFRFSTYAYNWVRQAITRAIHDKSEKDIYRIPVHHHEDLMMIAKAYGEVYLDKGRTPRTIEVYQRIKNSGSKVAERISLADVREGIVAMGSSKKVVRLDANTPKDEDETYGSTLIGAPPKTDTIVEARRLYVEYRAAVDRIEAAVDKLSPRSAMVIRLRYGMGEFEALTLEEIGERYEVTRERIRQIEVKALEQLESMLDIKGDEIEQIVNTMQELEVIAHAV